MENRTIARYGWTLVIVISLSEDANKRLTNAVLALADLKQRVREWDAEVKHDPAHATLTFTGTIYSPDFKNVDQEVSEVLYRLGASPNRVIVLSAVRGSRVAL